MNKDKQYMDDKSLKENNGGFQMPENYLQDFESNMLSKIEEEYSQEKSKVISLRPILMTLVPVAAILVLAYFLFINNSNQTEKEIFTSELSWDEYASFDENWIAEELSDLDKEQESDLDTEIDFLLEDGITTNEIIEIYKETP